MSSIRQHQARQVTRLIRFSSQHYAGLAIRMAEDIGIHKNIEAIYYEDPGHRIRARLLFWSLFLTDRLLAWSTGRQCTVCVLQHYRDQFESLILPRKLDQRELGGSTFTYRFGPDTVPIARRV
jgi:hypothetical protein